MGRTLGIERLHVLARFLQLRDLLRKRQRIGYFVPLPLAIVELGGFKTQLGLEQQVIDSAPLIERLEIGGRKIAKLLLIKLAQPRLSLRRNGNIIKPLERSK